MFYWVYAKKLSHQGLISRLGKRILESEGVELNPDDIRASSKLFES